MKWDTHEEEQPPVWILFVVLFVVIYLFLGG